MKLSLPKAAATGAPAPDHKAGWRVIRVPGASSVESGLARQQQLADEIDETATPVLMVWRCHQALLVSRTETRLSRFHQACIDLASTGWPVVLRKSGGGACPVGPGTVQICTIEPTAPEVTMEAKYAFLADLIQAALRAFGIDSRTGPVADAYCPGRFDIAVEAKKIAGMSQRWFRNRRSVRCVTTDASLNVRETPEQLAAVVNRFYCSAVSRCHCAAHAITNIQCNTNSLVADQDLVATVADILVRYRPPTPSSTLG
jgi:lipoate-protein ligase A